jgi:hypothetical protein
MLVIALEVVGWRLFDRIRGGINDEACHLVGSFGVTPGTPDTRRILKAALRQRNVRNRDHPICRLLGRD